MDVIALHQAGFGGAVAPLGTALTEEQLEELWRLSPAPMLCFDGDAAGARAAAPRRRTGPAAAHPRRTLRFAHAAGRRGSRHAGAPPAARPLSQAVLDAARPLADALYDLLREGSRDDDAGTAGGVPHPAGRGRRPASATVRSPANTARPAGPVLRRRPAPRQRRPAAPACAPAPAPPTAGAIGCGGRTARAS